MPALISQVHPYLHPLPDTFTRARLQVSCRRNPNFPTFHMPKYGAKTDGKFTALRALYKKRRAEPKQLKQENNKINTERGEGRKL